MKGSCYVKRWNETGGRFQGCLPSQSVPSSSCSGIPVPGGLWGPPVLHRQNSKALGKGLTLPSAVVSVTFLLWQLAIGCKYFFEDKRITAEPCVGSRSLQPLRTHGREPLVARRVGDVLKLVVGS